MGEALPLAVDDEVDPALGKEIDVLRAVASGEPEAEAFDQRDELLRLGVADREFDELGAFDDGGRRKGRQIGERRVAALRPPRGERFAAGAQRAHAVDGDRRSRGAAELIVEDLERERAAVARARRRVEKSTTG